MLPTPSEHRRPTPFTQDRRQLAEARHREEAAQRRLLDNEEEGQALRVGILGVCARPAPRRCHLCHAFMEQYIQCFEVYQVL